MKKRNYVAAILLASLMATSAGLATMPVSAADYTITITNPAKETNPAKDTATHTYSAYQVFKGTLTGNGEDATLSDVAWGEGVDGAALLTALKSSTAFGETNPFAACTTASDVANVIDAWENNAANLQKFADIVSTKLVAAKAIKGDAGAETLTVSEAGYYFINDTFTATENQVGANTDYLLKVCDSVTIAAKEDVPSLDKKIGENYNTAKKTSAQSIGDTVPYVMKSTVPNMSGYNRYYFVINDTMDAGLTFNNDVVIKIDGTQVPAANYEVQTGDAADGYTFQIVMKNFYANYNAKAGKDIIVTYSATLNEDAALYTRSNDNTAKLTFSNNPNYDYEGNKNPDKPDEPPTGEDAPPTGITPDSQTKTYTTALKVVKIDGETNDPLEGVQFRLSGVGVKTTYTDGKYFKVDNAGTYYQLKDGTFTETDPDGADVDTTNYVSTTTKYALVEDDA
ncbi:MAG: isopeptide-forming domain-containing fimbrial protein, partial [Oscillospiraceae bacterium]|nr:isopeptide-forming domain-containing fimbrial protein [Oscillospiraceae bacterium]